MQTLLVASDLHSCFGLLAFLHACGHRTSLTASANDAVTMMQRDHFDLLLIDLGLPQEAGVQLCAEVRRVFDDLVIIFLDRGEGVQRRVHVFKIGADDILPLPADGAELLARVRARRQQRSESVLMVPSGITHAL